MYYISNGRWNFSENNNNNWNEMQTAVDVIIMSRNDRDMYYDTYPLVVSLNMNPENYRNHVATHLLSESRAGSRQIILDCTLALHL